MNDLTFDTNLLNVDSPFILDTLIQLILAFVMALILRGVYIRFGTSISNRKAFSVNFFLLAMTITFIITIVKSSLALSLGLVGALSIVRFRSAIKEPEELAYLFITIAVGIGLGANQIVPTCVAFTVVVLAIILNSKISGKEEHYSSNSNLSLLFKNTDNLPELEQVLAVIKPHCKAHVVRRYRKQNGILDLGILVEFGTDNAIDKVRAGIETLDENVEIQFLNPQSLAL
ncbi:MAG: hypothetical protein COA42_12160 [Alteromonadaceae bacterium]|nr:MAG: hypothetical protein COA42_12160 [Alteromonadaceae bacterium]